MIPVQRSLRSRRFVGFLAACCLVVLAWWPAAPGWAQEPDAAPPAAAPAAAPAPDAAAAPPAGAPAPHSKSKITWFLESSGWIGAIILGLSIYFIATVARLFVELRPVVAMPPEVIESTNQLVEAKDFKGLFTLLKEDDSFFARLLSAGMAELSNGMHEAREAMDRVGDTITVEMEKKISMLAVLGTLGPMIGLLGTLKGMIASFSVIALSDTQLKASEVAGGISEALLLTFEGVALSVPAIYFFAIFRNRVSHISADTMLQADEYIRRINTQARARPAAGAAPPARPT